MRTSYCNRIFSFIILISCILCIISCDVRLRAPNSEYILNKNNQDIESVSDNSLPEDFSVFYDQFHTDNSFQIAHIIWPLPGKLITDEDDVVQLTSSWSEEDWTYHKKPPADGNYNILYNTLVDTMVDEYIMNRLTGHGILRRWRKQNDQWMLTYYSGLQSAERLKEL